MRKMGKGEKNKAGVTEFQNLHPGLMRQELQVSYFPNRYECRPWIIPLQELFTTCLHEYHIHPLPSIACHFCFGFWSLCELSLRCFYDFAKGFDIRCALMILNRLADFLKTWRRNNFSPVIWYVFLCFFPGMSLHRHFHFPHSGFEMSFLEAP